MNSVDKFCSIIRKRTVEHREAIERLSDLPGMMVSILRQELDSMVRVIYLLEISDIAERTRLIEQTLQNEIWTVVTNNGRNRKVTDREMVEISDSLQGWTRSVYKFGCAFIHFSAFHNYSEENPFELLTSEEKNDVLSHMRHYHGGPSSDTPNFAELSGYFPRVFKKIASNLERYVQELENAIVQPEA
ncbi:hypothetical protein CGJ21_24300 [Vibrio parahaemolyticus]|uniref:hypothetical protein n=1 Tax=Vibrio parahaemolyticus TaxID=670 RepID=UPI0011209891|nr:hypothetical protein [Vibrio parahaemolyticus]TOF34097.1 hypothetical protein CGJ23_24495 [Vibrio parahaemolyticus]TOF44277.1 hypothetical protein CGJ21_24300 [Vibrio parahaemolyticus]